MQYRRIWLCALVGCGFLLSAFPSELTVSVEKLGVQASLGARVFTTYAFDSRPSLEADEQVNSQSNARKIVPASRHIARAGLDSLMNSMLVVWQNVRAQILVWVDQGMTHTPALVMGLVLIALVPPLTIAGWFFRRVQFSPDMASEGATFGGLTQRIFASFQKDSAGSSETGSRLRGAAAAANDGASERLAFVGDAVLELSRFGGGDVPVVYPLNRNDLVVRVGREDDNEIQVHDKTVHRYHAAVNRSEGSGIAITDLSSADGNGLVVNGERVARAQLKDGDRIDLGATTFYFRVTLQ